MRGERPPHDLTVGDLSKVGKKITDAAHAAAEKNWQKPPSLSDLYAKFHKAEEDIFQVNIPASFENVVGEASVGVEKLTQQLKEAGAQGNIPQRVADIFHAIVENSKTEKKWQPLLMWGPQWLNGPGNAKIDNQSLNWLLREGYIVPPTHLGDRIYAYRLTNEATELIKKALG